MIVIQRIADYLNTLAGRIASVLIVLLVLCTVVDVCARYFFQAGSVAIQELEWHIFSFVFLLGSAWAYEQGAHVRIDIFFAKFSKKIQCWINILGDVFFLLPFTALIIWASLDFVWASFEILEGSPDAGGLPFRFIVKSSITIGFLLLFLGALANVLRNFAKLGELKSD